MASAEAFHYRSSELYCEDVPLPVIAELFGTPAYLYSRSRIVSNLERLENGLEAVPHLTCYSVKANSSLRILKLLADSGAGFDIVSGGELARVLRVSADPERIVFSGVGKTEAEITHALRAGILMFNVESPGELDLIEHQARRLNKTASVSIRINPDVEARTHPYISTGQNFHKFGVTKERARTLYRRAAGSEHLRIRGIACHIGSQILDVKPYLKALDEILALAQQLRRDGIELEFVDLGGGFGVPYASEKPLAWECLIKGVVFRLNRAEPGETPLPRKGAKKRGRSQHITRTSPYRLILEPGRSIVADAGALLTRVLYVKRGPKNFVIADAGMNDLMRPALYGSYHEIIPVRSAVGRKPKKLLADVVGPLCETGDFLARDRDLPEVQPGDLLAVLTTGAYGYALASNYNSRPRPAEVMVDGAGAELIRARQSDEDLMSGEVL